MKNVGSFAGFQILFGAKTCGANCHHTMFLTLFPGEWYTNASEENYDKVRMTIERCSFTSISNMISGNL